MNTQKKKFSVKLIAVIGLMAALIFVGNWLRFPIPISPIAKTAIHLGNVFCILAALLLGGVGGGLAAGIGGFFFDLVYPGYAADAPFTLVFRFAMGFVCGAIAYSGGRKAENTTVNIIAAIAGSLTYIMLFVGKGIVEDIYFFTLPMTTVIADAVTKAVTSLTNAVIAVVIAIPLFYTISAALKKAKISVR